MAHEPQASTHGAGHAKALPADLAAPAFVDGWKSRALIVGGISMCVALLLIFLANAQDHLGFDDIAVAFHQSLLALHHARSGALAELFD